MSNLPNPTPQGRAIIEAWNTTKRSIMVDALAGCGKTTFLQQLAPNITESRVLVLAFNKRNAEDLAAKMPTRFDCSTMNSIGHRALGRALARRLVVDSDKTSKILKKVAEQMGLGRLDSDTYSDATTLIRMAKSGGLMPDKFVAFKTLIPDRDESWEELCDMQMIDWSRDLQMLAWNTLVESNYAALREGLIDYDDQIYLSVLGNGAYEKYPVVAVDEAQDLSRLNHLQLQKSLQLGGRLIVVGDPRQAIYAFRGASSKSMGEIEGLQPGNFSRFPLSLTFRCAKVVVERNKAHAVGFEAAPTNLEGSVYNFNEPWNLDKIEHSGGKIAILCRNNAPLMAAAFKLIRSGQGVTMLGRDIGKSLERLLKKICGDKEGMAIPEVIEKVRAWQMKETDLARANGKEEKLSMIEDRAESIVAVAEGCDGETMKDVLNAIVKLFSDQSGLVVLGTGHRAKGMEWHTVIHLDPWRIPSKYAKRAEEAGDPTAMEQENNLRYVIETRTKDVLVLANLEDFEP